MIDKGPVPPRTPPADMDFTMGGRIPMIENYMDDRLDSAPMYSKASIDEQHARLEGSMHEPCMQWLSHALMGYGKVGEEILIVGSRSPFYEALALSLGMKPVTVDYNQPVSTDPRVRTLSSRELERSNEQFSQAMSISSFEHSGLGRYGDPLDPNGDIASMNWMRHRLMAGGLLFLSVPFGRDCISWNSHRVYGAIRFPMLIAGWELVCQEGPGPGCNKLPIGRYELPTHVLRR